jgi:hypothetical protein
MGTQNHGDDALQGINNFFQDKFLAEVLSPWNAGKKMQLIKNMHHRCILFFFFVHFLNFFFMNPIILSLSLHLQVSVP